MNVTTSLGTGFSADFLAYDETIGRVAKARHHVYALTGIEPTDILLGQRVYLILNHGLMLMPWLRSGGYVPGTLESIAGMRILIDPSF